MPEHPLKVIMDKDPELFSLLETTHELAFSEGGIPHEIQASYCNGA